MKILGIIGTSLGAVAAAMAGYLQFVLSSKAAAADKAIEIQREVIGDSFYGSAEHMQLLNDADATVDFGIYVLLIGGIAVVVSIVPAIKKISVAWIGVALGLISFFIGAAYGTHMFS